MTMTGPQAAKGTRTSPAQEPMKVPRTRTGAAWTAAAVGALLILLMLVFVLQNGARVRMHFLWMDAVVPLGAGLLLAGVVGALIVVLLGVGRMVQLRLAARRHRHADQRATAVSGDAVMR
jgi:uncharacterized integral membrane protein